ncbi:MAG: hypothetical protein ACJ73N_17980 [Bryobacteraceae bacterium]
MRRDGWRVLRIWEHEITCSLTDIMRKVLTELNINGETRN